MASVKISALKPLELDRLSDKDVFIVNDQDSTTLKIDFETLKLGLDRDAHAFMGDVEFFGKVDFLGPLAGRDVYTKTETDSAIADALVQPEADIDALEAQQLKITNNIGTTAATYITNELSGSPLSASPKNVKDALSALGLAHDAHTLLIDAVELKVDANASAIGSVELKNDEQDGRLDTLENAVGLPGDTIGDNTTAISDNSDLIAKLYELNGVASGAVVMNIPDNGGLAGDYTVIQAVTGLDSAMVTNTTNIATLTADLTANGTKTQENRNHINAIQQTLITTCTGFTGTADELATAIAAALTALTPLT